MGKAEVYCFALVVLISSSFDDGNRQAVGVTGDVLVAFFGCQRRGLI